jgi:hypothetical protein
MQNTGLIFGLISVLLVVLIFLMPQLIYLISPVLVAGSIILISALGFVINMMSYAQIPRDQSKIKSIVGLVLCGFAAFFTII